MNTKLVDSLVQIIQSLQADERSLLEEKLKIDLVQTDWQKGEEKLMKLQQKVLERRGGKFFDPPLEQYVEETRDERNKQQEDVIIQSFFREQQT